MSFLESDMLGVQAPIDGVVYPPAERLRQYFAVGALTRETLVDGLRTA